MTNTRGLLYNSVNYIGEEAAARMMPSDPMQAHEPMEEHSTVPWIEAAPEGFSVTFVDQNHDGYYDHVRWQYPWDPAGELTLYDSNLNGVPDCNSIYVDMDGDGVADTHLNPLDLDHDGSVDSLVGYTDLPHFSPDPTLLPEYLLWHADWLDWQHHSNYGYDDIWLEDSDDFDAPFGIGRY